MDTPCPGYRYRGSREALLDEVAPLVATTPPAICNVEERADVLCPVQIHVHDASVRERRRQTLDREADGKRAESRKWIDLDEGVVDGYILIDDCCGEPADESAEAPFPAVEADDDDYEDDDSHGKDSVYRREKKLLRRPEDFDISCTYPLANSHGNAYRGSSRDKYNDLYSEISASNYLDANRDDAGNYSVANSHGDHSVSSKNRCRGNLDVDQSAWDLRHQGNYEVANSHSNYRVFYDSQAQQRELFQASAWPASLKDHLANPGIAAEEEPGKSRIAGVEKRTEPEQGNESSCDIEQCLVEIEESLMNIEQNLLHVQDLDIPELRNLLYKSPSIEKSLFEVQDLIYADGLSKPKANPESDEEQGDEEEEEEDEEEVWLGQDLAMKDNDDEDDAGAGPFDASNESSDTGNVEESNRSESVDDRSNCVDPSIPDEPHSGYSERMNFVPNSLGKTPRRVALEGTKENIRLGSLEPEEAVSIDYNFNSTCAEKKLFCRDKCHTRTNSLDENSKFQDLESLDKQEAGKSSLRDLSFEAIASCLDASGKTKSEGTLENLREKSTHCRGKRAEQKAAVDAKAKDVRERIETIASHRKSIDQKRPMRKDSQEKDSADGKCYDKRKRKKVASRGQSSSENALVPSKLISLSLSLLLAALLQAVRCLTDLVEDAFRSVSYDRNGLLQ